MADRLISILIPAFNRPEYLHQAIRSVLDQNYRPLEILVSDDSSDDASERVVVGLPKVDGVAVRYWRNTPPLRQAANVNALLAAARGERLLLLHDDDFLLPGAITALAEALDAHPTAVAAYGLQRVCNDDGVDLGDAAADQLNHAYRRDASHTGVQDDAVIAGLLRQFPNNGYLINADVARGVGYRVTPDVGNACDADFGLRVSLAVGDRPFVLIDQYTCVYRLTATSLAAGGSTSGYCFYTLVRDADIPPRAEWARESALCRLAPEAVRFHARRGERRDALTIWLGKHHRGQRLTRTGLISLAYILFPKIERLRSHRSRSAAYRTTPSGTKLNVT